MVKKKSQLFSGLCPKWEFNKQTVCYDGSMSLDLRLSNILKLWKALWKSKSVSFNEIIYLFNLGLNH